MDHSGGGARSQRRAVVTGKVRYKRTVAFPPYEHPPGPEHRRRWGVSHNPEVAEEIASLDAKADCQRIAYLLTAYEFPFDTTRALELALFHTYGARRVAALLHKTGAFEQRGQKRYDDTNILIGQFIEAGWDNDRGARAIRRMNAIHGRFHIHNDDFLFVLWTFIDFPIDWMARFGWRAFTPHEEEAWFHFWRRIGDLMGITDVPDTRAAYDRFVAEYEAGQMMPSDAARRVVDATIDIMRAWLPQPLRGFVRPVVRAMARPALLRAAGYRPAPMTSALVRRVLQLRAVLKRWFPLEAYAKPLGTDGFRSYPKGPPPLEAVGSGPPE